ncbi:hypothetical protein CLAFUW4_10290 [Fulvia fulva]|uniref:DUF7730 domain-containing protein n=1 Tax=Passalora fulva TaxID=5499 RepID=A0A9Q8LEG5_PASFU|nr:uncharacterized protein CLAFUR5_04903 [Fulvia fulva]KAK4615348.1 hypothetical protein CLAFUR4_10294 [Fulvia fulva]KAK4617356.1 hypothetical protein CLAFUR0_10292 [Fulvia fulva]UJO15910.1 hypothetical protein CLAFUR5_04903 [Fulvia fulva]WPV19466.1 hypothetical protein CLAFUW4_10290 [Fulvia fulva]WPV33713.1 hypothetical protein CLAFUW7_10290 [Fulvia fulva]
MADTSRGLSIPVKIKLATLAARAVIALVKAVAGAAKARTNSTTHIDLPTRAPQTAVQHPDQHLEKTSAPSTRAHQRDAPPPSQDMAAQTESPLLALPPEIRNHIYELALCRTTILPQIVRSTSVNHGPWTYYGRDGKKVAIPQPSMLLTCKQIYNEAYQLCYANTTWEVTDKASLESWPFLLGQQQVVLFRGIRFAKGNAQRYCACCRADHATKTFKRHCKVVEGIKAEAGCIQGANGADWRAVDSGCGDDG